MVKFSKKLALKVAARTVARTAALTAALALAPQLAFAVYVPEDLKPWVDWALHNHKDAACIAVEGTNQKQCATYSNTNLDIVTTKGASFQTTIKVQADNTQVLLPGQTWAWPTSLTVNGQPKGASSYRNQPTVRLDKGTYTVAGNIEWKNTPAYLQLPSGLAQLTIRQNGKLVDMPQLRGDRLILQKSTIAPVERDVPVAQNTSKVQVFRLITDNIPAMITTEIRLTVTGAEREITLPNFHLANTEATNYSGRLPVKRLKDGSYVVQVSAGVHNLTFTDRFTGGRLESLAMPNLPWGEEVWAFNPMTELRLVEVDAETAINPDQTDMPGQWRNFASYLMHPAETLDFDMVREGAPTAPDNNLSLNRTMWLDQNGSQFTVRDIINGNMNNTWRLDQAKGIDLGRVNMEGRPQPLTSGANDATGIELRREYVNVEAIGVLPVSLLPFSAVKLPIGSWNTDFENATANVVMPTAWRPLAVTGDAKTRGTWMSQWNLYQFFFLLLTTAIAFRMWGSAKWAAVAFVALALTMQDHASLLSMVLVLLVFGMIMAALPAEAKLHKGIRRMRGVVMIFMVLFAVPFTLLHIQNALYPNLAKEALFAIPGFNNNFGVQGIVAKSTMDDVATMKERNRAERRMLKGSAPVPMAAPMVADMAMSQNFAESGMAGMAAGRGFGGDLQALEMEESIAMRTVALDEFDPNTRVPTGPGLPEWRHKSNSINLSWPEGISAGDSFRVWMLSPFGFRLLEILKVLVFGMLLAKLVKVDLQWPNFKKGKKAFAATVLAVMALGAAAPAHATDFPSEALLKDLEKRLLEPTPCMPDCAFTEKADLRARGDSVVFTFTINAEDRIMVELPSVTPIAFPSSVTINGVPAFTVAYNNMPYVMVGEGRNTVVASYDAGDYNNLNVNFRQVVGTFSNTLSGWRVGGLNADGQPNGQAISLSRTPNAVQNTPTPKKDEKPTYKPLEFAGYAKVTRNIELKNTWTVTTTIQLENGAPFTMDLPLLEGEKLLETQHTVKDGKVRLQVGNRPIVLRSEIEPSEILTLKAADSDAYNEVWQVFASSKWHVTTADDSIAPIWHLQGGVWSPLWRPYGGDVVTLNVSRPAGVTAQDLTIHNARTETTLRGKARVNTLTMNIETTRPQTHTIALGKGAKLKEFTLNGRPLSQKVAEGEGPVEVQLPLMHGMNNARIVWEESSNSLVHVATPDVNLNAPFVNMTQTITGLRDRWIVWTYGPATGPYVKLWAIMLGMTLLAWVMSKVLPAPLAFAGWFILALGFTQADPVAFLIPVGWLMLLQWRHDKGEKLNRVRFNLTQIAIVFLSLIVITALFSVVKVGLLGTPEVYIEGNNSSPYMLQWYQSIGEGMPHQAGACTLPMWLFRGVMMLWALWAALWLMRMFKWAWENFTAGGYWRKKELEAK